MKTIRNFLLIMFVVVAATAIWNSCKDDMDGKQFVITDEVMIDEYIMQEDGQTMVSFLEIIDKAEFRDIVHAYGTYTCFIPTNEGVTQHLSGKSISDLSVEECIDIVKYHIVPDTIRTTDFVDGRLKTSNMRNMYLTTRTQMVGSEFKINVNRQANILQSNIMTGNGYIHKIDNVLSPSKRTLGEQIMDEGMTTHYSIFQNIMKESGWADTLTRNKGVGQWYTVFLQDNTSFFDMNIFNINDLLERMKEARPDIEDTDSLLWTYAAYHCVDGLYYVADLVNESALLSLAPNQAITFKLSRDSLIVNEYVNSSDNTKEKGVPVRKSDNTDFSCYNGVMIDLGGYIEPKKRKAQALFWDVCTQPEFTKDSRYKKSGWNMSRTQFEDLSEITTKFIQNPADNDFGYEYQGGYADNWALVNFDALKVNMYRLDEISFKLPLLTEGTYNVYICFRRADVQTLKINGVFVQDGQDEQVMSNLVSLYDYYDTGPAAEVLLATKGMKRYVAKHRSTTTNSYLLGTVVVQSTGRHNLKLVVKDRGRSTQVWIDMFHFIPVDDNQLWPRFDKQGTAIWPGTPCNKIWPFDNLTCPEDQDAH